MRHPSLTWAGLLSMAIFAVGCAGKVSTTPIPANPPTEPARESPKDTTPAVVAPPVEPKQVLVPDSTGPEVRVSVVVEKNNLKSVRTRLIPRVMGKGWTLSVNKSDSIEFLRNADPDLTAMLFHSPPLPASRIRLRFRLEANGKTVKITSTAHLVGMTVYPYRPVAKILEENLAELRDDLIKSPSVLDPLDKTPPKPKKK
jgi:hypothetical protein